MRKRVALYHSYYYQPEEDIKDATSDPYSYLRPSVSVAFSAVRPVAHKGVGLGQLYIFSITLLVAWSVAVCCL